MLGDPQTGLLVYNNTTCGDAPCQRGGTSLACPLFSGTMALINEQRLIQGKSLIGAAAPYLYTYQSELAYGSSINPIVQPHLVISGAVSLPSLGINDAPLSSFAFVRGQGSGYFSFAWDSSLAEVPGLNWSDTVGFGSPNVPNFVMKMADF